MTGTSRRRRSGPERERRARSRAPRQSSAPSIDDAPLGLLLRRDPAIAARCSAQPPAIRPGRRRRSARRTRPDSRRARGRSLPASLQPVRDLSGLHRSADRARSPRASSRGSSKLWSRSVTFPERSSCVFFHRDTAVGPAAATASQVERDRAASGCAAAAVARATSSWPPAVVLEEVADALLLHQPADEVEVGLAVLDAVVARRSSVLGRARTSTCRLSREHLPEDVGDGHLLEDAASPAVRVRSQSCGTSSARYACRRVAAALR